MMNKLNYLLCLTLLPFFLLEANAQKETYSKLEFFRVPADMAVVLLASRDKLPVRIESAKLFTNEGGQRIKCAYQFRNVGDQSVRAIEVTIVTNFLFRPTGGGRMESYSEIVGFEGGSNEPLKPLSPGESRSYGSLFNENRLLADDVVEQIRKQPSQIKAKFVVALIITKIEFASGKVLDLQSDAHDLQMLFTEGIGTR